MSKAKDDSNKFQIFRSGEAPELGEAGVMAVAAFSDMQMQGMQRLGAAGLGKGGETRLMVNLPGFSLVHVWFKQDFPLPLHSHDSDCLYYVVAGSLTLGSETLGPRDSFFVPADAAYTYTPGPDGVEVLEFRTKNDFDFKLHAKGEAYFERALATVEKRREGWTSQKMPALNN